MKTGSNQVALTLVGRGLIRELVDNDVIIRTQFERVVLSGNKYKDILQLIANDQLESLNKEYNFKIVDPCD